LYSRDEWFWIVTISLASVQIFFSGDFSGFVNFKPFSNNFFSQLRGQNLEKK